MRRPARRHARVAGFWLVAASAVVLVAAVLLLVQRTQADSASAERAARAYSPTVSTARAPTTVSVVADEATIAPTADGAATDWPQQVASALDAQVFVIDSGAGYVRTGSADAPTFVNHAGEVAPRADVVLIVGGASDAGIPVARLRSAAIATYASATATAPDASLVVVGPIVQGQPTAQVLAVRDALRSAVAKTHARFLDPIGADWFTSGSFSTDGTLTATGKRTFAAHIETELRQILGRH